MGLRPYMTDKVGLSYATVALLILSGFCHGKCRRCIELCRTSSMLFDVGLKMALLQSDTFQSQESISRHEKVAHSAAGHLELRGFGAQP